jgi:DNA-binding transcriptional MerR regulator
MTTLRIAEVSERTGVPATTLRYYEDIGLLAPAGRSENGYRAYEERDVERLRFITRAKRLDISLDDLRELVQAWDTDDCASVQDRMAQVVSARLTETQERIVDLVELAGHLQSAAGRLAGAPEPGPCGEGCACSTAPTATDPTFVELTQAIRADPLMITVTATPSDESSAEADVVRPPIACTLDHDAMRGRISDWQAVLTRATSRGSIAGGVALTFAHDVQPTAELARLAAAEHGCCTFFDFTLEVTTAGVRFEVRAPVEAHDVLAAVFGPPGPPSRGDHHTKRGELV